MTNLSLKLFHKFVNLSCPCWPIQGEREEDMEEKRIERLYELLERAEREKDEASVAALRWAIFSLE